MQYRTHDDGALTTIRVVPGAVIVSLKFDVPGAYTKLHSHAFPHTMRCIKGPVLISIGGTDIVLNTGENYVVDAHKEHSVRPLTSEAEVECVHEHADIDPQKMDAGAIPIEWLDRLTDKVSHARQ
jgi:quercetin dioxygenase-like cupin family protein